MTAMNSDPRTTDPRRRLGGVALFGLWAAAAAVSVGVGFGAVHLVGQEVINDAPRTLSAPPSADPTPAATGSDDGTPASRPARPAPTRAAPPARGQVRTVVLTGGTVAVRCQGNAVSLLYATPRDGYSMDKGHSGPHEVEVEFEGPGGKSRLKAYCSGGRLLAERR